MMLKHWLPVALVLMAFAMRTAWLAEVPPGLHHDEVIYTSIAEKALGGGWSIFYPEGQGREGFYIPFLAAALKWLGTGAFALRVPSAFLSVLGLCAVYALTRRLFGSWVALFALAEMCFTFWSLFPGRVAMRAVTEPLVAALAAYALWVAVHTSQVGGRRPDSTIRSLGFVVAGLLIGLTVYTYRGARALPAIVVVLPVYLALFDRATLRRTWRGLFVCAVVVVMVAAPLVILLTTHPGLDQLGWAGRDRVLRALSAGDGRPMLSTTVATLGAFFFRGDPDDYYNLGGRPVFGLVTGALFAVGVLLALKRIRQLRYAYLLMWFALALAPGMVSEPAPHFYHILGAQMAAFAFPGISLQNLKSRVSNLKGRAVHLKLEAWYLILVLALVAADGVWNARDYFMIWGRKETVRVLWNKPIAEVASYLDHTQDRTPVVVCTLLVNRQEPWLRPAPDFFRYLMRRDATRLRFDDCRYSLILPDGGAVRYAFPGTAPVDRFESRFLTPWLDGATPLESGRLSPDNALLRVDARQSLDTKLDQLAFTPVDFGHAAELIGYELPGPDPRPGQPVVLITWWRVKASLSPDLTLFVHLLRDERIVAQQDLISVMPDTLQPGDVFAQVHEFINVPPDAQPGDYLLAIGLYDSVTGQRLTLFDGEAVRGDRLVLRTVRIP
jgi:4-amino-4-deoxy-L-arabinose transferase-like glycosyltransferase